MRFDNLTFDEAVERILDLAHSAGTAYAVTPNVDHIVLLEKDPEMRAAYRNADLVLCDGAPVLWALRWLGQPLIARAPGSDLLPALCRRAAARDVSVFFLGGEPGVAASCAGRMQAAYPGLIVAGSWAPPMGVMEDAQAIRTLIETVAAAKPDLLFVALGTPAQEKVLVRHGRDLGAAMAVGVGAALDFVAGRQRRAPHWMRRAGLEWLWRLACEPRRLFKRYVIRDSRFLWIVLREWRRMKSQKGKQSG